MAHLPDLGARSSKGSLGLLPSCGGISYRPQKPYEGLWLGRATATAAHHGWQILEPCGGVRGSQRDAGASQAWRGAGWSGPDLHSHRRECRSPQLRHIMIYLYVYVCSYILYWFKDIQNEKVWERRSVTGTPFETGSLQQLSAISWTTLEARLKSIWVNWLKTEFRSIKQNYMNLNSIYISLAQKVP